MIKVNRSIIEIEHYPDGTPRINVDVNIFHKPLAYELTYGHNIPTIEFWWSYENDAEIIYLSFIKKHFEKFYPDAHYHLCMPYIPNARMDRIKDNTEVFTLKYFVDFINSLNFDNVIVLDAHSNVSVALLNRCIHFNGNYYIEQVLEIIRKSYKHDLILYFPDAGAAKRYSDLFPNYRYCYGEKKRDWKSGKILGLDIRLNDINLTDRTVLMIDDIISYGGSLHYSAIELKKNGANKIYAYATHTENSILDKEKGTLIKDLENNTVERLFTTNSLFTGSHEKITVMEV